MSLCLIVFFFHKQTKKTRVKKEMRAKITSLCIISFIFGLNMFLVPQVLMNFEISPSSKLDTNLILHL